MSLWSSIKGLVGGGEGVGARVVGRIYLVDGERLAEGRGDRVSSPVERVQILQKLSQFAEREEIKMQVVFAGRPLREVADGGQFGVVTAYFSEQPAGVADRLEGLFRSAGRDAVVISSDKAILERITGQGGAVMRSSTLRKALEGGGEQGEGNGGGGRQDRDRGRRDRPRRDRRGGGGGGGPQQPRDRGDRPERSDREPRPEANQQGQGSAQPSPQSSAADTTVKNLIDLV